MAFEQGNVVGLLENSGLFTFDGPARDGLAAARRSGEEAGGPGDLIETFVGLSAAEFALISPQSSLPMTPLSGAVSVDAGHLRLASLKTDSTIDWPCLERVMGGEPASPSLVTVYAADAIRLEELGWQSEIPGSEQRIATIEALQGRHVDSPLGYARSAGAAGLVTFQGLIWHLKSAVLLGEDLPEAMSTYASRFGFGAEPLGM